MDLETFRQLLTDQGQVALRAAVELVPREKDFLTHFQALSRRFPAELARTALEIAILRQEAAAKFPGPLIRAEQLYFTRPALEQASNEIISLYRAERFRPFARIADLGCSVGGDTLALASIAPTIGLDLDPLRLAMAQANLRSAGLGEQADWLQADLNHPLPIKPDPELALFFDPARRTGERRLFSVHDYQPALAVIWSWLPDHPALGVKISPGVNLEELAGYNAEVEFISLQGELKEAVLWFGPLKSTERRATVLPGPYTFSGLPGIEIYRSSAAEAAHQVLPLSEPQEYIYEPDPAVLRAGLVQALGVQLEAAQLDPDIAYLTSDYRIETPFARSWKVETWLPFGVKRLRQVLRQRGVTQVVVKKRGSPLQPEELIQALRLKNTHRQGLPDEADRAKRILFLTHLRGRPIVVICLPDR